MLEGKNNGVAYEDLERGCLFDDSDYFAVKPENNLTASSIADRPPEVSKTKACKKLVSQAVADSASQIRLGREPQDVVDSELAKMIFENASAASSEGMLACLGCYSNILDELGGRYDGPLPEGCSFSQRELSAEELAFALGGYGELIESPITGLETTKELSAMGYVADKWVLPKVTEAKKLAPQAIEVVVSHLSVVTVRLGLRQRPTQAALLV